jgi:hypothetical protein
MTDRILSSAAKTVLEASAEHWDGTRTQAIAAALRAAADQVVPEPDDWDKDNFSTQALRLRCVMRDQILAIADELEGAQ